MSNPIAVCISDLHFSVKNLELASTALRHALNKAESLGVPLIIAGDLNDSKAIIRAEVANRLIEIFKFAECHIYIMVGNHDLINERGRDHGLNFLDMYATIIDEPYYEESLSCVLIPYITDFSNVIEDLKDFNLLTGRPTLIMHQGFHGADTGDYVHDKSAISADLAKDFTVISGHYHRHQAIGTVTYIGSPYTQSFGEANDGPKGYLVLNSDGTYTREILRLRKHIIYNWNVADPGEPSRNHSADDLVWIKVVGTSSDLIQYTKKNLEVFVGHSNFKLDLIATEERQEMSQSVAIHSLTDAEVLDKVIETSGYDLETVTRLKALWREL